jgi:hypothetical protein
MDREREATLSWSFGHANELPNHLGLQLPRGWWCAFFLLRSDVFGGKADGDIDFLAGPTRYSFGDEELAARLAVARAKDPQFGEARFHYQAGREGLVVWPPEVQEVVACEIKASCFADGKWKQTHSSSGARAGIRKQLKLLYDYGVNRVALLHLGVTKPTDERIETWRAALAQLASAVESFPDVFPNTDVEYGHLRAVMAATHDGPESRAGAHAGVTALRPPGLINPIIERPWHRRLRARLAELPQPMYLNTFIQECSRCRRWRHSSSPDVASEPCVCVAPRL